MTACSMSGGDDRADGGRAAGRGGSRGRAGGEEESRGGRRWTWGAKERGIRTDHVHGVRPFIRHCQLLTISDTTAFQLVGKQQ